MLYLPVAVNSHFGTKTIHPHSDFMQNIKRLKLVCTLAKSFSILLNFYSIEAIPCNFIFNIHVPKLDMHEKFFKYLTFYNFL